MREGEIVRATVSAVHDFGLEVEAEGRRGFVQPAELNWTAGALSLSPGDAIDVLVYAIEGRGFFASVKRVRPELNPWKDPERFKRGTRHLGVIKNVLDWGCAVEIDKGISGMIDLHEYPGEYVIGAVINTEVVAADPSFRKIELKPV